MRPNTVKHRIQSGHASIGTFVFEFATSGIGRIVASAAADFVIFDMEHTGWSVETIRMLLATSCSVSTVPLVRIPTTEYDFIARVLDMGASGIMVPMVESAEQAALIVASAKYPPVGRRGAAFTIAHDDYLAGDVAQKIKSANEESLIIAQIETASGLNNVEAIAAVAGVDVLWIGQFDLTNSLGIPGQFDHPRFRGALDRVLQACRVHKKTAGFMALDIAEGRKFLDQGFRMIAYSGDLWLYQQALNSGIAALKQHGV